MKKTEAICFPPPLFGLACSLSDSISLVSCSIQFTRKVRDLGFGLHSDLTTKQHVIKIYQSAYLELKRSSYIRQYLTEEATKTLVTSCILSRLDFCNSLLMATPNAIIQPLQTLQNSAARLVFRSRRTRYCTPLLHKLHWLPIAERIRFKVCCLCFKVVTGSAPVYLFKLLHAYTPSRTLRSSSDTRLFAINRYKRMQHGFLQFRPLWPPHLK